MPWCMWVRSLVLLLASAATVAPSAGQTVTWSGATNGDWSLGSNYVGGVPPAPTDVVIFDGASAGAAPSSSSPASLAGVDISASCPLASITLDGALTVNGSVVVLASTLVVAPQGLSVSGDLVVSAGLSIPAGASVMLGGDLDGTSGTITWGSNALLTMNGSGQELVIDAGSSSFQRLSVLQTTAVDVTAVTPATLGTQLSATTVAVSRGVLDLDVPSLFSGLLMVQGEGTVRNDDSGWLSHRFLGNPVSVQVNNGAFSFTAPGLDLVFKQSGIVDINGTATFTIHGGPLDASRIRDEVENGILWTLDVDSIVAFSVDRVIIHDSSGAGTAAPLPVTHAALGILVENWNLIPPFLSDWTGAGGDNRWSSGLNWEGGTAPPNPPSSHNDVVLGRAAQTTNVNDLPAGAALRSMTLGVGFSVSGNPIALDAGLASLAGSNVLGLDLAFKPAVVVDVASGSDLTLSGAVAGSGGFVKTGSGPLSLTSSNPLTGSCSVNAGSLVLAGDLTGAFTTIQSGATAAGTGTYGPLTVASGGTLDPGPGTESVATGDLTIQAGGTLGVTLDGTAPGDHDRVVVSGSVAVGGAALSVSLGFAPSPGDRFVIVANDGAEPIGGSFAGLPEGASFIVAGVTLTITYAGGDGNDVELSVDLVPVELLSFTVD